MNKVTRKQAIESESASDVIRMSLSTSPISLTGLANIVGVGAQSLESRLRASSMRVSSASEMLGPLGFDLVAVPKGSVLPSGSYKVAR